MKTLPILILTLFCSIANADEPLFRYTIERDADRPEWLRVTLWQTRNPTPEDEQFEYRIRGGFDLMRLHAPGSLDNPLPLTYYRPDLGLPIWPCGLTTGLIDPLEDWRIREKACFWAVKVTRKEAP